MDPRTGTARTAVRVGITAYVFTAAGSVWTPDDRSSTTLVRFTPGAGHRVELSVGNGTSALVESGNRIWIANHRDATLEPGLGRRVRLARGYRGRPALPLGLSRPALRA